MPSSDLRNHLKHSQRDLTSFFLRLKLVFRSLFEPTPPAYKIGVVPNELTRRLTLQQLLKGCYYKLLSITCGYTNHNKHHFLREIFHLGLFSVHVVARECRHMTNIQGWCYLSFESRDHLSFTYLLRSCSQALLLCTPIDHW